MVLLPILTVPQIFKPQFLQELIHQLSNKTLRLSILSIFAELCEGKKDGVQCVSRLPDVVQLL